MSEHGWSDGIEVGMICGDAEDARLKGLRKKGEMLSF
jgi:hypothetical protein